MKILIVGTGYVGLVTGACFAEMGHHVICLDIDPDKITKLNNGQIPIYEPGLEEIVKRNVAAQRLEFTTDYNYGVKSSLICFIAVATPAGEDGSADLSYVLKAARQIAQHMDGYRIIANKSTVPVYSALKVSEAISHCLKEEGKDHSFDVVSNPEFLKEGDAISDFMKPDRIVIGSDSPKALALMQELYAPFNLSRDRIFLMDTLSAELTKYAANAMLATRISFMNEMAGLCKLVGADISMIRKGIGSDQRIGYPFLYPGIGYGGSCFPKDVKAIGAMGRELGYEMTLVNAVEAVNERQKEFLNHEITSYFDKRGGIKGKTFAIWGLAFKPGTDDMREAPSLVTIRFLLQQGAYVRLYDPIAMQRAKEILKTSSQIYWCSSEFEAAEGADAIILVTEWKQFRFVDFTRILPSLKNKVFFDGRNQYSPKEMAQLGFDYICIGRPAVIKHEVYH